MKPISWMAAVAGAVALLGTSLCAQAQTQSQVQGQSQMQTQPADMTQQPTPAPIVIETKVDLTGGPQTPESQYDAQKEATAALAEAKTACRQQPRQAQSDCLRQAQDDYHTTLARARH